MFLTMSLITLITVNKQGVPRKLVFITSFLPFSTDRQLSLVMSDWSWTYTHL